MAILLPAFAGLIVARRLIPALLPLLADGGLRALNFRGEGVSVGYGAGLALVGGVGAFALGSEPLAGAIFAFAFLGLLDDVLGNRSTGGLRGHLGALGRGTLTTGAIKAVVGAAVALAIASRLAPTPMDTVVDGLLIALWANALNLLDVRPGRALKAFLPLGLGALSLPGAEAFAPLWGAAIGGWPTDLGTRGMMGDVGSNTLGAALGMMATTAPLDVRVGLVALLLLFHLYTEHHSISTFIEQHPGLRRLDEWGRT